VSHVPGPNLDEDMQALIEHLERDHGISVTNIESLARIHRTIHTSRMTVLEPAGEQIEHEHPEHQSGG